MIYPSFVLFSRLLVGKIMSGIVDCLPCFPSQGNVVTLCVVSADQSSQQVCEGPQRRVRPRTADHTRCPSCLRVSVRPRTAGRVRSNETVDAVDPSQTNDHSRIALPSQYSALCQCAIPISAPLLCAATHSSVSSQCSLPDTSSISALRKDILAATNEMLTIFVNTSALYNKRVDNIESRLIHIESKSQTNLENTPSEFNVALDSKMSDSNVDHRMVLRS